jgi:tetratricopeptide (TPR) repeat protein
MEQTPLFLDEYVLLNDAQAALNDLRLEDALAFLNEYRNLYPGGKEDVEERLRIVNFLQQGISALPASGPELPGMLLHLWRSFESFCGDSARNRRLPESLKPRFFRMITAAIEAESLTDDCFLEDNIPVGYIYLQTGQYSRAIRSLQTCLLTMQDNAALFGYLGDAWWERGSRDTARQVYFEACLIAPCAVDWRHLRDEELKGLLEILPDAYGWESALACEWFPACAYIRGIFKPKRIRALEEMSAFTESYRDIRKAFSGPSDPVLAARIFTGGIVLCDNEPFLRNVRGIDFADIRRDMKSAEPRLFAEYMKELDRRRRM